MPKEMFFVPQPVEVSPDIPWNNRYLKRTVSVPRFQESHQTYREVIKNTDDDFNDERMANLAAVLAQLGMTNQVSRGAATFCKLCQAIVSLWKRGRQAQGDHATA